MTLQNRISTVCGVLEGIPVTEHLETITWTGECSAHHFAIVLNLVETLSNSLSCIKLFFDSDDVEFLSKEDLQQKRDSICPIDIQFNLDKKELLKSFGYDEEITLSREILLCSITSFKKFSSNNGLGINNPFQPSVINSEIPTRIQVYKLPSSFGGSQLAVIPTDEKPNQLFLQRSNLPTEEALKKAIHVVSNDAVSIRPLSFELTWGDLSQHSAEPFLLAYIQILYACLATHFYSIDRVILTGVKQLETSIRVQPFSNYLTKNYAKMLASLINWCYAEEDYDTRRALLVDRLSLECPNNSTLLKTPQNVLTETLVQAKSKYRYVIAERNDSYRKELKEVYEDIKSFSDSYAEKASSITTGLITDLLSMAFILSMGAFAKAAVYGGDLLRSPESVIFFKAISVYLVCSFTLRYWHAKSSLEQSNIIFDDWSGKLRNHIPKAEVNEIKRRLTWKPERHFFTTAGVIGVIQIYLAFASWHIKIFLYGFGL